MPTCPPTGSGPRRRVSAGLALLGAAFLTACTGGASFSAEDLDPGVCRDAADALLQTDDSLSRLADSDLEPAQAAELYAGVQERLATIGERAEPDVAVALRELRTQLGFFRAGVASGTHTPEQDRQVRSALDGLLRACGASPQS